MLKVFGSLALSAATVLTLCFATAPARADVVTTLGDTTGTGPWNLTSTSTTYSNVDIALSTPFALGSLTDLSATFTDNSGGADGGSPRFALRATNGDFFLVYLGSTPSFIDSDPAAFTSTFSGLNLDNGTNNSADGNSGTYVTLASLMSDFGTDSIDEVDFIVDGGWAANGEQDLTVDALDVNGTVYATSAVPEPASLALFGTALVGLMLMWRRKRC